MKTLRKINYRGFEITIKETSPTRFGIMYFSTNDYGEPVINQLYFQTIAEAVEDGKRNLNLCLES